MTIREYYQNYANNKEYGIKLASGADKSIPAFYHNCIARHVLPKCDVLAWHEMLMEYAERPDAILWIRYYEGGDKKYRKSTGRWNNRRACMTTVNDEWSYVFVSNFDVHEIFNMIHHGVTPDVNEFADMMNRHEFPFHYDTSRVSEELDIVCFDPIGSKRAGVLTVENLYLAHIHGIKTMVYLMPDGTVIDNNEAIKYFPRGQLSDWKPVGGHMIRELTMDGNTPAREIAKAHFLRFTDPLNYYIVPGPKHETNAVCPKGIGEYEHLNLFMAKQFEALYGKKAMDEFRKAALIPECEIVEIVYGSKKPSKLAPGSRAKGSAPTLIFDPADENRFKQDLLNKKKATITWKYKDGHEEVNTWKIDKFSAKSDIRGNVHSKKQWRNKDKNGLIEVVLKV